MKIKAIWGFKGDPGAVGNEDGRVLSGQVLTVDDKYGHHLIGAKLAKPFGEADQVAYRARVALSGVDQGTLAAAQADILAREDALAKDVADLEARRDELVKFESTLAERERSLGARESEMDRREAELTKIEGDSGPEAGDASGTGGKPGKQPKSTKPAAPDENK